MKKSLQLMILLAAAAVIPACEKQQDTPAQKSLTANVRLYFTSSADPYLSYKIYAVAEDESRTDITSKAAKVSELDTLNLDQYIWEHMILVPEIRETIYAMVFDDTLLSTGKYGYEVVFSKIGGQSVVGTIDDLYGWSIKATSTSGLDMSQKQNSSKGDFNASTIDNEIIRMNDFAKGCKIEVKEK